MKRSPTMPIFILILAAIAIWIDLDVPRPDWVKNLLFWRPVETRDIKIVQGLDLQGGLEVLMQAVPPAGQAVTADSMQAARLIVEQRINGLGVTEPLIQQVGADRLAIQLPGIQDPDLAIKTFGETGLLEFVDTQTESLPPGVVVSTTSFISGTVVSTETPPGATPAPSPTTPPTPTATATLTATQPVTAVEPLTPTTPVLGPYRTIMTGSHLQSAQVAFDPQTSVPIIQFTLTSEGARIFADHTRKNVGRYLTITLDKRVISSPVIRSEIPSGQGVIEGGFTQEEAQALVVQLKYGALPVPLKVLSSRNVGPTLGQDSINKSMIAGVIGIGAVILFMLLYYRLPGFLANLALLLYGAVVLSIFKLLPVTLTLAGIAGFVLSIGMAVDANVLIFERMKEELRSGRSLRAAMRAGFDRAWLSIRDSNVSSLITCAILFWFGSNFGASIVAGFALTLAIGIMVSLFTAIAVTRTLINFVIDLDLVKNLWWFGVSVRRESK